MSTFYAIANCWMGVDLVVAFRALKRVPRPGEIKQFSDRRQAMLYQRSGTLPTSSSSGNKFDVPLIRLTKAASDFGGAVAVSQLTQQHAACANTNTVMDTSSISMAQSPLHPADSIAPVVRTSSNLNNNNSSLNVSENRDIPVSMTTTHVVLTAQVVSPTHSGVQSQPQDQRQPIPPAISRSESVGNKRRMLSRTESSSSLSSPIPPIAPNKQTPTDPPPLTINTSMSPSPLSVVVTPPVADNIPATAVPVVVASSTTPVSLQSPNATMPAAMSPMVMPPLMPTIEGQFSQQQIMQMQQFMQYAQLQPMYMQMLQQQQQQQHLTQTPSTDIPPVIPLVSSRSASLVTSLPAAVVSTLPSAPVTIANSKVGGRTLPSGAANKANSTPKKGSGSNNGKGSQRKQQGTPGKKAAQSHAAVKSQTVPSRDTPAVSSSSTSTANTAPWITAKTLPQSSSVTDPQLRQESMRPDSTYQRAQQPLLNSSSSELLPLLTGTSLTWIVASFYDAIGKRMTFEPQFTDTHDSSTRDKVVPLQPIHETDSRGDDAAVAQSLPMNVSETTVTMATISAPADTSEDLCDETGDTCDTSMEPESWEALHARFPPAGIKRSGTATANALHFSVQGLEDGGFCHNETVILPQYAFSFGCILGSTNKEQFVKSTYAGTLFHGLLEATLLALRHDRSRSIVIACAHQEFVDMMQRDYHVWKHHLEAECPRRIRYMTSCANLLTQFDFECMGRQVVFQYQAPSASSFVAAMKSLHQKCGVVRLSAKTAAADTQAANMVHSISRVRAHELWQLSVSNQLGAALQFQAPSSSCELTSMSTSSMLLGARPQYSCLSSDSVQPQDLASRDFVIPSRFWKAVTASTFVPILRIKIDRSYVAYAEVEFHVSRMELPHNTDATSIGEDTHMTHGEDAAQQVAILLQEQIPLPSKLHPSPTSSYLWALLAIFSRCPAHLYRFRIQMDNNLLVDELPGLRQLAHSVNLSKEQQSRNSCALWFRLAACLAEKRIEWLRSEDHDDYYPDAAECALTQPA